MRVLTAVVLIAACAFSEGAAQLQPGTYATADGQASISVRAVQEGVEVVYSGATSLYRPIGTGHYVLVNSNGSHFGLRVVSATELETYQPGINGPGTTVPGTRFLLAAPPTLPTPPAAAAASPASVRPAIRPLRVGPVGTPGGTAFDDHCDTDSIAAVIVRAGYWIDGLQLLCHTSDGLVRPLPQRSGPGGTPSTFILQPGERILAITGSYNGVEGPYLYSIQFVTNRRYSQVYGNTGPNKGQDQYWIAVPGGFRVVGLYGSVGQYLHTIGLMFLGGGSPVEGGFSEASGGLAAVPLAANSDTGNSCPRRTGACTDDWGLSWQTARGGAIPTGSAAIGNEMVAGARQPIYACRAYVIGESQIGPGTIIGTLGTRDRGCKVAVAGDAPPLLAQEYEVLAGSGHRWAAAASGVLPPTKLGAAAMGEPEYFICRPVGSDAEGRVGMVYEGAEGCMTVSGASVRVWPQYTVMVR